MTEYERLSLRLLSGIAVEIGYLMQKPPHPEGMGKTVDAVQAEMNRVLQAVKEALEGDRAK